MKKICLFLSCFIFLYGYGRVYAEDTLSAVPRRTESRRITDTGPAPGNFSREAVTSERETGSAALHETFIRQAFALAISAAKKGNHPFGALLVHNGKVILTSENTVNTDNDFSSHAEINLLVRAKRELPPEMLRRSTMYTSTAPCMTCCSAMMYRGVGKIVFGVSYDAFAKLTGFRDTDIPCDRLYRSAGKPVEWIGPILEREGLEVFRFWPEGDPNSKNFLKNPKQ